MTFFDRLDKEILVRALVAAHAAWGPVAPATVLIAMKL
jgi:hypothetical protein